jgi:glycopeptide antibiotics resistance protein
LNQTFKSVIFWLALGWTIIIAIGCLLPGGPKPVTDITNFDKIEHLLIFGGFGFLWRLTGRQAGWVFLVGITYGMLLEVLQYLLPIDRSFDLIDAVANTIGVLIGLGAATLLKKLMPVF